LYYWSGGKLDSTDAGIAGVTHRSRFTYESKAGRVTGRLLSSTDPAGHVTSYAYFSTGSQNLQQVTVAGRATVLGYDAVGRTTTVQDPRGLVASHVYDALNRDSVSVGFAHDTTRVGYDALFNTSVRNAAGQIYTRYPNALGWDTLEVSPSGRTQQLAYDMNGNITRYTTSRNRPVTFTYDALDGMTTRTADGATTTFAADPLDRFIATANSESVDTTRFDVAGRLEKEIAIRGAQRFERTSSYDAHGNRAALAVSPWGTSITYHYDALMRLDTLQDVSG
jgi:YD repeat-containing protein